MFSISSANPYSSSSSTPDVRTIIDFDDNTPKVCLNMIVKNESNVILRLLNSVLPLIDGYCICDTGSTDNTVEIIENFMKENGIPGKIVFETFQDFGYNRTHALNEASKIPNMDYILLMDADMILTGSALLNPAEFKATLNTDCYNLCQGSPTYYYKNTRIVRNYKGYSYWGVTHEYVNTPNGTQYDSIDIGTLFIEDIGDGGAKTDKFERDIRLLTKGLEENPGNDRYTFYLANSLRDAGRLKEAIDTYRKRIAIGGWIEEVWHSYYSIGNCYKTMGEHDKAISAWIEGFDYHPKRIEGLYEIVNYYRLKGKNRAAYLYYISANESNKKWGANPDYLFMQKDVYDYKLDYELSIIGYYVNDFNYDLARTSMKVLQYPHAPDWVLSNVLSNYKFYSKKLIEESWKQTSVFDKATESLNIHADGVFVKSTPSLIKRGNHLIINVRYVNYRIDDRGNYVNQQNVITRNAIAVLDISGPVWRIIQEFELKYDTTKDGYYIGLEDIRLFLNSNNTILYNANRGMPDGTMTIEHGEISLDKESTQNSVWPKLSGDHRSTEKNWVLFEANNELKCIYHWNPALTVGDIIDDKLEIKTEIKTPHFFKYLRGSTNGVLINGELWFICHVVSYEDRRYYYHIVVVLDAVTFEVKRYTKLFTFEGAHVEYTLGFIHLEMIDELLIGYSLYDKSVKYVRILRDLLEKDMIKNSEI